MAKRFLVPVVAVVVLAAFMLSGCGDDDDEAGTGVEGSGISTKEIYWNGHDCLIVYINGYKEAGVGVWCED